MPCLSLRWLRHLEEAKANRGALQLLAGAWERPSVDTDSAGPAGACTTSNDRRNAKMSGSIYAVIDLKQSERLLLIDVGPLSRGEVEVPFRADLNAGTERVDVGWVAFSSHGLRP